MQEMLKTLSLPHEDLRMTLHVPSAWMTQAMKLEVGDADLSMDKVKLLTLLIFCHLSCLVSYQAHRRDLERAFYEDDAYANVTDIKTNASVKRAIIDSIVFGWPEMPSFLCCFHMMAAGDLVAHDYIISNV